MVDQKQKKTCMFMFIRHGERLDEVDKVCKGLEIQYKHDPPLTWDGMDMASKAGSLTKTFLQDKGYEDAPIKFIASPHIRTIQTACAF